MTGCNNDDDSPSAEPAASVTFDNVNDAAYTVLRSLTDLTQYDENKAVNSEDNSVSGIETLPDDWSSRTFTCDEGYVLNEITPKVRSIPVNCLDDALEFFSNLIGEIVTADSLSGNTYKWSYPGLGTLKFSKVSGNDNLFATMDVALTVMPGLTQIRFISKDAPELTAGNSYSGLSYYHAGDVIRRNKDNTYWICVRPSGGPYKKDKSYWIALDAFNNKSTGKNAGKITIKSEEKKVDGRYNYKSFKQTWKYAKDLMSLKTAKAAFHTFSALVDRNIGSLPGYENAEYVYSDLSYKGIDLLGLHKEAVDKNGPDKTISGLVLANFAFAYGSPKDESNRGLKLSNSGSDDSFDPNVFKTVGQVKHIQPILTASARVKNGICSEEIVTCRTYPILNNCTHKNKTFLYSLTDGFDMVYMQSISMFSDDFVATPGATEEEKASKYLYDFNNFLHRLENYSNTETPGPLQYDYYSENYAQYMSNAMLKWHVIVSPELVIKDNKGDASSEKRPVGNDYTDIYLQKTNSYFDYWKTFDHCERMVDLKKVNWKKEND